MRAPLSWLREYVALPDGVSAEQVAADLVRVGLEEEEVHGGDVQGPLVVGRVLEFAEEPQKNGKTIRWCLLDVGNTDAAGETVPDWSGGTRLGETLRFFLDRWGQRGMARGAVVVVFSDGWERGDASVLAEQMARLGRISHRVVWVNPHRGKEGYEAVQTGVLAALPYCDDFVAGHSLATYADLVEVLADA